MKISELSDLKTITIATSSIEQFEREQEMAQAEAWANYRSEFQKDHHGFLDYDQDVANEIDETFYRNRTRDWH